MDPYVLFEKISMTVFEVFKENFQLNLSHSLGAFLVLLFVKFLYGIACFCSLEKSKCSASDADSNSSAV